MPPSIPKTSIGALARFRCPHANASIHLQPRSFSTSTSLSMIGPENPRFIEIPTTLQPKLLPKKDIKGTLPPPRNLFPKRGAPKTTPQYFASTIPKPAPQKRTKDDYVTWKRDMASVRRKNLREGLQSLHARKLKSDRHVARRSLQKTTEREARLYAPQREDERLTNPTVTKAMNKHTATLPDPSRKARVQQKEQKVQRKEAVRAEERRTALHTLYMHARSFISTEQELNAEIDKIFVPRPFASKYPNETNIWNTGSPPTIQEMLSGLNKTEKRVTDYYSGPGEITKQRMKKIAEELTGGKMD